MSYTSILLCLHHVVPIPQKIVTFHLRERKETCCLWPLTHTRQARGRIHVTVTYFLKHLNIAARPAVPSTDHISLYCAAVTSSNLFPVLPHEIIFGILCYSGLKCLMKSQLPIKTTQNPKQDAICPLMRTWHQTRHCKCQDMSGRFSFLYYTHSKVATVNA